MGRPIDREAARDLLEQGLPRQVIAKHLGCHPSTIDRLRKRLGIPAYVQKITDDERVAELTRRGWAASRIAEVLHVTPRSVQRARVRVGVSGPAPRVFTDDELARAEMLFADGCSLTEVARTLGRNLHSVRRRFPGRGWTMQQVAAFRTGL